MPKTNDQLDEISEKLDDILLIFQKMNKRDRLRTIGGFFKSLIPIAVIVVSTWYFIEYGDEMLAKVAEVAAEQAAVVVGQEAENALEGVGGGGLNMEELMQQVQQMLPTQ